ncbi:hypothetical protein Y032_0024g1059 [Ancylostoma ceylanicum]|nr:hypothetical protein Y032_0024g1059 [Ancylostoma ceylanicum]
MDRSIHSECIIGKPQASLRLSDENAVRLKKALMFKEEEENRYKLKMLNSIRAYAGLCFDNSQQKRDSRMFPEKL